MISTIFPGKTRRTALYLGSWYASYIRRSHAVGSRWRFVLRHIMLGRLIDSLLLSLLFLEQRRRLRSVTTHRLDPMATSAIGANTFVCRHLASAFDERSPVSYNRYKSPFFVHRPTTNTFSHQSYRNYRDGHFTYLISYYHSCLTPCRRMPR